jgi:hypothetical protein
MPRLPGEQVCAINCTSQLSARVVALIESSISENTRRAYQSDLAHFEAWGGRLPADPAVVASYLAAHAETLSGDRQVNGVWTNFRQWGDYEPAS